MLDDGWFYLRHSRFTLCMLLYCTTALPVWAADITWSGVNSRDWQNATNWVGGIVPLSTDNAIINLSPGPRIDNGGLITVRNTYIGHTAGLNGAVTVAGAGSVLENALELRVGNGGTGNLTIENGGKASSASNTHIGFNAGSIGTVAVNGANSLLESKAALYIATSSTGNLKIENGGKAKSSTITYIGHDAGVTGTATVTGTGSRLEIGTNLYVGRAGTGILSLSNGGKANGTSSVVIGMITGSHGRVTVNGSGSALESQGTLVISNDSGSTGRLMVENGGKTSSAGSMFVGYNGGTNATISVTGLGSLLESNASLFVGYGGAGSLTVSDQAKVKSAVNITLGNQNGSVGTLNIGAAAGDAATAAGLVEAPLVRFALGTGKIVFNHTDDNYNFSSNLSGNGTLEILSGVTNYTGNGSLFTGVVNVTDGVLRINGVLSTSTTTTISGDGRFEGTGSIGNLIVRSGGTLAPGNSIGTTHVVNAMFDPDSIYEVEVNNAGQSDLLEASGTVTLNGGYVRVYPLGYQTTNPYTIVTAAGSVSGVFDGVMPSAVFTGHLAYIGNDVLLTLTQNPTAAHTFNQNALASIIRFAGGNTAINALFNIVDVADARSALDALSGEIHASATATHIREQRMLRDAARRTDSTQVPDEGTIWARGFDQRSHVGSDGNAASAHVQSGGVLMGVERSYNGRSYAGVAGGYSLGDLKVNARGSKAQSQNYHAMMYGGTDLNDTGLSLQGGTSITWHEMSSDRDTSFTGFTGRSHADYDAQTAQVFTALGQKFIQGDTEIKPYMEASYILHRVGSFKEDGAAGLKAKSTYNQIGFANVGVDAAHEITFDRAQSIKFSGGVAWQHAIGFVDVKQDMSWDMPNTDFTTQGTPLARDALNLHAGIGFEMGDGVNLSVNYSGSVAEDMYDQDVSLRARVTF
jgi:T5SS/PEP-CTERM-associated repeat protein